MNKTHDLFYICAFILFILPVEAQTNRALIVAISNYPIENGWDETHATNDCELLTPMLKMNGYKRSNIKTLLNENATKSAIVKELELLEERAETGDYIYIHFSGHGQQMADDNGDEPDFLDEAFIPYNAYYRYIVGKYEGENHLRDDELECLIDKIRSKIGETGSVLVIMDACHSGTGTRVVEGEDYVRGTSYIFAPDNFVGQRNKDTFRLHLYSDASLAPVTVFSACQPDELNYEFKTGVPPIYYGSLSFFFYESVKESTGMESNLYLYLRIKDKMERYFRKRNKSQTPYFESTAKDRSFRLSK